jgi:hypothetical protein
MANKFRELAIIEFNYMGFNVITEGMDEIALSC